MFSNYLKIAWRNLWKHKAFTAIIVFGMAVAFCAAILLSLTACYELSYDQFHTQKDRLFQLYFEEQGAGKVENSASMPSPLTPALQQAYKDVVHITRMGNNNGLVRYKDKELDLENRSVDADFFTMFTFPLLAGNTQQPLQNLQDVVLSATAARKIFDQEAPVGKTIEIQLNGAWKPFTVSAIIADHPTNSSISYEILTRFENYPDYNNNLDKWNARDHEVFVQLAPVVSQAAFEQKMPAFVHKHFVEKLDDLKRDGVQAATDGEYMHLRLEPFTNIHYSKVSPTGAGISKFYPYLLLIISAFILFIACVNFINLSLARSFTRAKEIGIRKVMGAARSQVLSQFWGEALLVTLFAFVLGLALACLLLPGYKTMLNQPLTLELLRSPRVILYLLTGFVLIAVIAGGYPAWIVSAFNTIQTVKGKLPIGKSHTLRNTLMVVQFSLSSLLIICTLIIWQQLSYLRNKPLGYNKQQVISIPVGEFDGEKALTQLRAKLSGNPQVLSVTGADMNLGLGRDGSSGTSIIGFDYNGHSISSNWMRVDYDYLQTLGIKLKDGRDFSKAFGMDSLGVLINEKMAQQMGTGSPVGKFLPLDDKKLQVLGVVENFHFKSLHREIAPLTMTLDHQLPVSYLLVRVQPGSIVTSMNMLQQAWKEINPQGDFKASYLDENTDRQYRKETRLSKIFMAGAVLAILISCVGLFAMALLVIVQRTKEIGIRKILGASVPGIVKLVSKDFLKLVLIAVIIASPIAWYVMHQWLQDFAYRIPISVWVFVLAAVLAITIAFITLGYQSVKAALSNPVKNLRTE